MAALKTERRPQIGNRDSSTKRTHAHVPASSSIWRYMCFSISFGVERTRSRVTSSPECGGREEHEPRVQGSVESGGRLAFNQYISNRKAVQMCGRKEGAGRTDIRGIPYQQIAKSHEHDAIGNVTHAATVAASMRRPAFRSRLML